MWGLCGEGGGWVYRQIFISGFGSAKLGLGLTVEELPCEGKQYHFSHCTHEENTNMFQNWDSNPQPMVLTSHYPIGNKIKSEITIIANKDAKGRGNQVKWRV